MSSSSNVALSGVIAFMLVGILVIGFYLVIPATYLRVNATDLGAVGNATLDNAYVFATNTQSIMGAVLIVLAAVSIVIVLAWVFGRRLL